MLANMWNKGASGTGPTVEDLSSVAIRGTGLLGKIFAAAFAGADGAKGLAGSFNRSSGGQRTLPRGWISLASPAPALDALYRPKMV